MAILSSYVVTKERNKITENSCLLDFKVDEKKPNRPGLTSTILRVKLSSIPSGVIPVWRNHIVKHPTHTFGGKEIEERRSIVLWLNTLPNRKDRDGNKEVSYPSSLIDWPFKNSVLPGYIKSEEGKDTNVIPEYWKSRLKKDNPSI